MQLVHPSFALGETGAQSRLGGVGGYLAPVERAKDPEMPLFGPAHGGDGDVKTLKVRPSERSRPREGRSGSRPGQPGRAHLGDPIIVDLNLAKPLNQRGRVASSHRGLEQRLTDLFALPAFTHPSF